MGAIRRIEGLAPSGHKDRRVQELDVWRISRTVPPGALALRSASPLLVVLARSRNSPHSPVAFIADPAQVALGQALAARAAEATQMTAYASVDAGLPELVSGRIAKSIHDVHKLASREIARFLVTGQGTTEIERKFVGKVGVMAAVFGLSITTITRSYLLWRDSNLRVLNEEVRRLGTSLAVYDEVRRLIRSTAEIGIKRMSQAYEDHMQAGGHRDEAATFALKLTQLRATSRVSRELAHQTHSS